MGQSLIDHLEASARRGASLTMLGKKGDETRTHSELVEEAKVFGAALQARGIGPGSRVGIVAVSSFDFVLALLSTFAAEACAVLLPQPPLLAGAAYKDQVTALARNTRVAATLGPATAAAVDVPHINLEELASGGTLDAADLDGEGMIQFTSGTTGDPRAVLLSRHRIAARVVADSARPDYDTESDVLLSWRDLSTSAGIFPGLLTPLGMGVPSVVMSTAVFRAAPERWLIEISRRRVTVSGGPNFAYVAATRSLTSTSETLDLSCWRLAECAGERIDAASIEGFVEAAAPHGFDPASIVCIYGMTEAGIVSISPRAGLRTQEVSEQALIEDRVEPASDEDDAARVVSLGHVRDGVSVRIVDASGEGLEQPAVGEVAVRTPWLTLGYLKGTDTHLPTTDEHLLTGDRGYISNDELFLTGRSKNVIIIRGRNYNGEDLERALHDLPGLVSSGIAVVGRSTEETEELVVFAETHADGAERDELPTRINERLWRSFNLSAKEVVLMDPDTLPRNSTGKLRREELKASLR
ncbi:MAG TPA: AMP-binding protein [Actinomycetota bacterium]|nr:AMP-binding protein [Actinomycetota bacterium]